MSERFKGILSVITIVACLGLLGFLVKEKAEGAAVAAAGAVTVIIAWITRRPSGDGTSLIPLIAAGTLISLVGCGVLAGDKAAQAEDAYRAQQIKCVHDYEARAEIDECRRLVRQEWGIVETAAKDGGK